MIDGWHVNDWVPLASPYLYPSLILFSTNLVKFDCEVSYHNLNLSLAHSRWNSSHICNEVWEESESRPILTCTTLSKESSGTIFITSGQGSLSKLPAADGANALPLTHLFLSCRCLLEKAVLELFFAGQTQCRYSV